MRKNLKESRLILTILLLVGILGVGYATLGANLKINGVAEIPASSWLIRFKTNTIHVTDGSVSINTANNEQTAQIDDATNISYKVRLALPGDFYEFTVDVENAGSIDAMIDSVSSKLGNTEIVSGTLPSYLMYSVTYSDGVPITAKQLLAANGGTETIKVRLEFKKDVEASQLPRENTTLALNFQMNYVQADNTAVPVGGNPSSFATDDWSTIIRAAKRGDTSAYTVGSTKTIDMGTFGTHTLRIANNSTPAECSQEGFSQTACGFVLEFADIISIKRINQWDLNENEIGTGSIGGWEHCELRPYINDIIYNALPIQLKNAVKDTKVVSGYGPKDLSNFVTWDKLYFLSSVEVWGGTYYDTVDSTMTRQLDYYRNSDTSLTSYASAGKKNGNSYYYWWLRSAHQTKDNYFVGVWDSWSMPGGPNNVYVTSIGGISPAFRLG